LLLVGLAQFLAKVFVLNWLWGVLRLAALARSFNPKVKNVFESQNQPVPQALAGLDELFFTGGSCAQQGRTANCQPHSQLHKDHHKDQYKAPPKTHTKP
jgi:hypothetical protein